MAAEDHDDADSGGTLRDILADLAATSNRQPESPQTSDPVWTFTPRSSHSSTPRQGPAPNPRTSSAGRPYQQQRALSSGVVPSLGHGETGTQGGLFSTPGRSIFASGPPTSSISANTAQASLSPALPSSSSARPLSVLSSPQSGTSRKSSSRNVPENLSGSSAPLRRRTIQVSEKDVDDPTTINSTDQDAAQTPVPTTLSKLFVPPEHPGLSRPVSHIRTASTMATARVVAEPGSLTSHLLHRGLMDGRHSDILIHAFGNSYRLHKLMLDRVPFFRSAFSGPWAESSAKEMELHPEQIDTNITRTAFDLALKRIYGSILPMEEDQEAVGLFATGCWLDMADLIESSLDGVLRQLHPSKVGEVINIVTTNYYGKPGDRILASAKAVLCREGWEMPYEFWDDIPADIIREVIGGDPFYVPGEWERWYLTVRLLNRRLKARAMEAGLIASDGQYIHPKPSSLKFFAVRFDTVYRRDSMIGSRQISDKDEAWVSLYTHPDIAPLLVLLDEGIHYVHLRFEQLQQIRDQKDIFGVPIIPEKVIMNSHWASMELRQRVVNANETDLELGLTQEAEDYSTQGAYSKIPDPKGKEPEGSAAQEESHEVVSGSWDGNGKPRKFWIPSTDSSSVMGGTSEAYMASTSAAIASWTPHMARLSNSFEPSDAMWATDLSGIDPAKTHSRDNSNEQSIPQFSHFPPFRFSAEFPNPRTLKEKKRVYSQTVWYAGSMWNLYIQRINTSKSHQLGIYLHRAKEREPIDDPLAQLSHTPVQEQIRQVERDMRKNERRNRNWGNTFSSGGEAEAEDESGSGAEMEGNMYTTEPQTSSRLSILRRSEGLVKAHKTSESPLSPQHTSQVTRPQSSAYVLDSDEESEELARTNKRSSVSALPLYTDARPTIRTYFKIYSPSKAGRMLSIYESAPDRFNFSQSWGWKSSSFILDDGAASPEGTKGGKDGKLRYMVVIGNV
ncbi:MAG: hypothetical protein Q9227_002324 [Pyrenula ochraceoflavens]